jgi:hypothetical protein
MSLIIQHAKYQGDWARRGRMGDPGLFSFIGKAVKSVGKAVGGVVKGAVGGLLGGGPVGMVLGGVSGIAGRTSVGAAKLGRSVGSPVPGVGGGGFQMGGGVSAGGFSMGGGISAGGGAAPGTALACLTGHHVNRSGYYAHGGYVPAGTACVKNRRMNPLNPRALSRAMRRITSAKRAASVLNRITIRSGCAPGRRRAAVRHGKGCKCVSCK